MKKRLGELLLERNLITEEQLNIALQHQKASRLRLGKVLTGLGFVTEEEIARVLAEQYGLSTIDLTKLRPDPKALEVLPASIAQKYQILPFALEENVLHVAISDPLDFQAEEELRRRIPLPLRLYVAPPSQLEESIRRYYSEPVEFDRLERLSPPVMVELLRIQEDTVPIDDLEDLVDRLPIVQIVNTLIADAVLEGASDIHLEPQETRLNVRYRIDGYLRNIITFPKHLHGPITSRIKVIGNMDIAQTRRPQDGRARVLVGERQVDLRISTLPTIYGEKTVIRLLNTSDNPRSLSDLGIRKEDLETLKQIISRPQGLILTTGPTGSGKTTTLYAILHHIRSEALNIITVEDPVEYQIKGINQVQVDEKAGLTFASALRSILRQDPNVILVGEIRDLETAQIALRAALTGHLVLSTLHTNDASSTPARLVEMGLAPFLVASALTAVIAQRLVRRVCPYCSDASQEVIIRGKGCQECAFTGLKGRIGVYEILVVNEEIRQLILNHAPPSEIRSAARRAGMRTLWEDAQEKIKQGLIPPEELLAVPSDGETSPFLATLAKQSLITSSPVPSPASQLTQERTPPEAYAKEKILVVDDSPTVREMLKQILEDQFFEVITASDGVEGLEKTFKEKPDLIITDILMPRMDGYELVKHLKRRLETAQIPVIMLTTKGEVESEVRGLEVGADDYIPKPVDPQRLIARVHLALRKK